MRMDHAGKMHRAYPWTRKRPANGSGGGLGRRAKRILTLTALGPAVLTVLWPLAMLLGGALMGPVELMRHLGPALADAPGLASWALLPQYPTLRPLVELLVDSPKFFVMFWNSCALVFPILFGQLVLGAPAAWGIARFTFKGRNLLFTLYIALMLMPFQVTMVSTYLTLDGMRLLDSRWAVILPAAFSTFPVFIMVKSFSSIPQALLDAMAVDGVGPVSTFWHIGLPLGAPGVASAMILGFLEYWNAIEQPLTYLRDKSLWPLSLYLPKIAVDAAGVSLAASLVMLLPALLLFLLGQQDLEMGIRAAGLKE